MTEMLLVGSKSRKSYRTQRRVPRLYWLALGTFALAAALALVFQLLIAPNLLITQIKVESDFSISEEELLSIAGIQRKEYYFSIRTDTVAGNLASYPVVRAAKVRKIFPDTLEIVLQQRVPLVLSFSYSDEKMVPVAFDEEGMLFQIGNAVTQWDLPVISGLRFKPMLGLQLPARLTPFLEEMKALRENAPELFDLVSEIKVTSTNEIDYELLLYPVGYSTRINLGERIDEDAIKYALMVLDVLADQGMDQEIEELDFRGRDVVYRLKEG